MGDAEEEVGENDALPAKLAGDRVLGMTLGIPVKKQTRDGYGFIPLLRTSKESEESLSIAKSYVLQDSRERTILLDGLGIRLWHVLWELWEQRGPGHPRV